jgi:hypothetical protein
MKMKHVANRRRSVSSCAFIALLALVLVIGCVAGGTVAWLVAKTEPVVNTFTYGNINIALAETTGEDYKIIPGKDISKDPKVTVKGGSEACWLFVKVEEVGAISTITTDPVHYAIDTGWAQLKDKDGKDVSGVYYRLVDAVDNDTAFNVLKDNKIIVSGELTKETINGYAVQQPTLTFMAYAVQKENIDTAADAWAKVTP